jgi:histidinol-phosphatase (PHP family)
MIDYHIHTKLCKHAEGDIYTYVEKALEMGLHEIAFTDHIPLPNKFDLAHRMAMNELDLYSKWIDDVRSTYPEIIIRFGIEADYYHGFESFTEKILNNYDFDVVIMSIHFLRHWPEGNWVFNYNFPGKPIKDIYSDYIDTLITGINTGLFDILGHADIIKLSGKSFMDTVPEKVDQLLKMLRKKRMAIEINTSGYRKGINETYPGLDWMMAIQKANVPLTLGSDAHAPEQIALNFKSVLSKVKNTGITTLSYFDKRKMGLIPIE